MQTQSNTKIYFSIIFQVIVQQCREVMAAGLIALYSYDTHRQEQRDLTYAFLVLNWVSVLLYNIEPKLSFVV